MRWLPLLILFLLIYIEVALFVRVADAIGVFLALVLVVFTSVMGAAIARRQGMVNLYLLRQKLQMGENPAGEIVRNVTLMLAGVLLFLPGFLTDFLGLLLLLPPIQRLIEYKLIPYMTVQYRTSAQGRTNNDSTNDSPGRTIEGEFHRKDDDEPKS